jgi:hypothetical protein
MIIYAHTHTLTRSKKENKIVLVGLSAEAMEGRRDKENIRE